MWDEDYFEYLLWKKGAGGGEEEIDVGPWRTVLYPDGHFIINESAKNQAKNEALHGGEATNVYDPFDPNGSTLVSTYTFNSTDQRPWHAQCALIKTVEIGSGISPSLTAFWFSNFNTCTSIDLTNLNTSVVTNMRYMFSNCKVLTSLDLSNFDTSAVRNMSYMFSDCRALTSLDLSSFNTSVVTTMQNMFYYCQALTSLDVSNFNTSAVTNMQSIFSNCQALTSLNLSNFNTSVVTTMQNMFYYCQALTSLDLSSFNTSVVTTMNQMFTFCRALTNLDLSSFNTSVVTNMSSMFNGCSALRKIYVSANYIVTQVTSSSGMFYGMSTNLVGGAGTRWSSSNPKDKTYAKIDGGTSDPGYFTLKE